MVTPQLASPHQHLGDRPKSWLWWEWGSVRVRLHVAASQLDRHRTMSEFMYADHFQDLLPFRKAEPLTSPSHFRALCQDDLAEPLPTAVTLHRWSKHR